MFWKKEEKETPEKEVHVSCSTCKCWLSEKDAHKVSSYSQYGCYVKYYCQTHKVPYSEVNAWGPIDKPTTFRGMVSMKADGTPIGYVKAPEPAPNPVEKEGDPVVK